MQPTPEIAQQTNPGVVQHLGLAVYRPHDPEIAAVLFNPNKISLKEIQKADKAGKLDKVAKPLSEYFGSGPGGVGDGPTGGLIGNQVTQDQPANAPSPAPVAIQPKSTFGADAQKMAAEMQAKNFAPATPTAGPRSRWWSRPQQPSEASRIAESKLTDRKIERYVRQRRNDLTLPGWLLWSS